MKRIFLALCICASAFLFAENSPQLHMAPSVRQQGFGGFYTTDIDNYYGFYANPAMLGKHKKHTLYPAIQADVSGPLADIPDLLKSSIYREISNVAEILKKNGGIKLGMYAEPLLSTGHISEWGFGWGVSTNVFVNAIIPDLARSDVNVGAETIFTTGFGFPIIHTDNHLLSVGATAKGFFQMTVALDDGILSIASKLNNFAFNSIPLNFMAGFGFDLGAYYSICNCLDFAVVYHDPWSPTWISNNTVGNIFNIKFNPGKALESKLSAGLCWRVHTEATRGVISSFRIMADYQNIFALFNKLGRNPWLEARAGLEIEFLNMISLRFGVSDLYPAAGVGIALGKFKIDMSIYGKELGLEPGSSPSLNASVFIGVTY